MVGALRWTRRGAIAASAALCLRLAVAAPALPRLRTLGGAYLVRPPAPGEPAGSSGMFARWGPPLALALHGDELLLADARAQRLWRVDLARQTMRGVAGAPVVPGVLTAIGPDGSAWVLDHAARQVLRFARDGRLLRTLHLPRELLTPVAMALAADGSTLLLADGAGAQWVELGADRPAVRWVVPRRADGGRVGSVDALATTDAAVYLLDRHHGVVWRSAPDGRVDQMLGHGELLQPHALAVDSQARLIVHDAGDACLKLLLGGRRVAAFDAPALGLGAIGAMAYDGGVLAVADAGDGAVTLFRLAGAG